MPLRCLWKGALPANARSAARSLIASEAGSGTAAESSFSIRTTGARGCFAEERESDGLLRSECWRTRCFCRGISESINGFFDPFEYAQTGFAGFRSTILALCLLELGEHNAGNNERRLA